MKEIKMVMTQSEIDKAIDTFMHPTIFTGVKPVLIIAEELVTEHKLGQIVEAVWFSVESDTQINYISKFAVNGKIILGKYHTKEQMEPFAGRVALAHYENLKKVVFHQAFLNEIKKLQAKRAELLDEIKRDFDELSEMNLEKGEIYLFIKDNADWSKKLFSDFDIDFPYSLKKIIQKDSALEYYLENPKTKKIDTYSDLSGFYGYVCGSKADIAGLKLKSESLLKSINSLENDARVMIKSIDWLELNNPTILELLQKLPKHPFEEYFKYVAKEKIRDMKVQQEYLYALEKIIEKHMPQKNNPLGIQYIAIDKLLYLFHAVIPRKDALVALEECDIVYEPPGIVLGFEGKHQLPPKFLVPIAQVAKVYQQFEGFKNACRV